MNKRYSEESAGKLRGRGADPIAVVTGILLIVTLLYACLNTGLYFKKTIYLPATLWLAGFGVLMLVRSISSYRNGIFNFRNIHIWVGPAMIALLYGVHLLYSPASVQGTWNALIQWSWLTVIAVVLTYTSLHALGRQLIRVGWHVAGLLLSLTALISLYGVASFSHVVLRTADSEIAAFGARLGGLLQYPNSFGALMGAFWVLQLCLIAQQSPAASITQRVMLALPTLPYGLCLLLSESRGAWLAALIAWGLALLQAQPLARRRLIIATGFALSGALLISRRLIQAQLAPEPGSGLAELAIIWGVTLLLMLQLDRIILSAGVFHHLRGTKRQRMLWLYEREVPVLVMIGSILIALTVPVGSTEEGIRTELTTARARWVMVQDGWEIFKQAPWLGQGGDTWRSLYRSIESLPYVGAVLHSGWLDNLLNLGIGGLIVFILWLGSNGWKLFRQKSLLLAPYVVLLIHAAIDIDMAFGLYWLLLLWIPAMNLSTRDNKASNSRATLVGLRVWPLVLSICILGISLISLKLHYADQLAHQVRKTSDEADQVRVLDKAFRLNPAEPAYALRLVGELGPIEAAEILSKAIRYSPYQSELYARLGTIYGNEVDLRAVGMWVKAARLDPYNANLQTESIRAIHQLAIRVDIYGQSEEAGSITQAGRTLFKQYEERANSLSTVTSIRNDRNFHMTQEARDLNRSLTAYGEHSNEALPVYEADPY